MSASRCILRVQRRGSVWTWSGAPCSQLFSPDGFWLAARAVLHAAVQTVIFAGCCLPPRLHQRSVINMHCGSPSRSCMVHNEAVVGLVIIVETTVQRKHSHAASCLIERWQICSQNTSATCIVWQMCFSFPLPLFLSPSFWMKKSSIFVT